MRFTWVFLILALLFGYLTNYIWHTQTPFQKDRLTQDFLIEEIVTNEQAILFIQENVELGTIYHYLNIKNLIVLFVFASLSLGSFIIFTHTLIDKLFFKKYYEEANMKIALRRAVMLIALVGILAVLRLIAGLTWFTFIPLFCLFCLIEYFFVSSDVPEREEDTPDKDLVD